MLRLRLRGCPLSPSRRRTIGHRRFELVRGPKTESHARFRSLESGDGVGRSADEDVSSDGAGGWRRRPVPAAWQPSRCDVLLRLSSGSFAGASQTAVLARIYHNNNRRDHLFGSWDCSPGGGGGEGRSLDEPPSVHGAGASATGREKRCLGPRPSAGSRRPNHALIDSYGPFFTQCREMKRR